MSGTLINLIVQIIAGAIGGNGAGAALKDLNLGTLGNTIAGAIGGGAGGQLLSALIPALAGADITTIPRWNHSRVSSRLYSNRPGAPSRHAKLWDAETFRRRTPYLTS
jgi:hypothetical protein